MTAFSLVELLVTIVIIICLAVLVLAATMRFTRVGQGAVCVNNLRQLSVAIHAYAADNAGNFPVYVDATDSGDFRWNYILRDGKASTPNGGVLPDANYNNADNPNGDPHRRTAYQCPANPGRNSDMWWDSNYAYSRSLGENVPGDLNAPSGTGGVYTVRVGQLAHPAITVVLADSNRRIPDAPPWNATGGPPIYTWFHADAPNWSPYVGFEWHQGKANLLMADGHVETLTSPVIKDRVDNGNLLWAKDNSWQLTW